MSRIVARPGSPFADRRRRDSSRVVYAALAGNVLVAASKYAAAAVSASSAMLTEAIHSTADCINQVLLLIGMRRGSLPADSSHRFGYGAEIYFWTFVVAVLVLLAGGAYSVHQGMQRLAHPSEITSPGISLAVLLVSALFEATSFRVAYREYKTVEARYRRPGRPLKLVQFIRWSKDPSVFESLLEDGAALVGLVIAAAGVVAGAYFELPQADGAASLLIGFILFANGTAILIATRSLVAGEAVAPPVLQELWSAVRGYDRSGRVSDLATLHLGPGCILIAVTMSSAADGTSDNCFMDGLERVLRAADARVRHVLFHYASH